MDAKQVLTNWLEAFEHALKLQDVKAVTEMFAEDSYWRDLVSFTWNIKTSEGREQITDMLNATLAQVKPANLQLDGEANEADGIIDRWINFETNLSTGRGHIRLRDGSPPNKKPFGFMAATSINRDITLSFYPFN